MNIVVGRDHAFATSNFIISGSIFQTRMPKIV